MKTYLFSGVDFCVYCGAIMFLRHTTRKKNGKEHRYWSIVENKRLGAGRVVQRPVLYLGEINSSGARLAQVDRSPRRCQCDTAADACAVSRGPKRGDRPRRIGGAARLSQLQLLRPRQWGACWLALKLWQELHLDRFFAERLPASRKGTRWDQVLFVLVAYRLIAPGSEWFLHREWFGKSALADLLGADFGLAEAHKLYACHDLLLAHKEALFTDLTERWRDLFNVGFDVLLYDLTSTYFESDPPQDAADKRRFGHSRDKRSDCVQVVIALVVTPEGLPLAYEVLAGNTADNTTLRGFLDRIEAQYGKARRIWVMDRGIPTEAVLEEMRQSDPAVAYLVGTPKGRLSRLERDLLDKPWHEARPGVRVKLLAQDQEVYVLAHSVDRSSKERAMRRRQLKWLWARLAQVQAVGLSREALLMKLGAARQKAPTAWRLVKIDRRGRQCFHLRPQARHAAPATPSRRALLVAHQPGRHRPGRPVELLPATRRRGRGLQDHQGRSRHPPDLPSGSAAHRGPHLHRLHRLLPPCDPDPPSASPRARAHRAQRHREVRCRADDRREGADNDGRQLSLTRYTEPEPELKLILHKLRLTLPAQKRPTIAAPTVAQPTSL